MSINVMKIARECRFEFRISDGQEIHGLTYDGLISFAAAIIEECAMAAIISQQGDGRAQARYTTAVACANAIRALKPAQEG